MAGIISIVTLKKDLLELGIASIGASIDSGKTTRFYALTDELSKHQLVKDKDYFIEDYSGSVMALMIATGQNGMVQDPRLITFKGPAAVIKALFSIPLESFYFSSDAMIISPMTNSEHFMMARLQYALSIEEKQCNDDTIPFVKKASEEATMLTAGLVFKLHKTIQKPSSIVDQLNAELTCLAQKYIDGQANDDVFNQPNYKLALTSLARAIKNEKATPTITSGPLSYLSQILTPPSDLAPKYEKIMLTVTTLLNLPNNLGLEKLPAPQPAGKVKSEATNN